MSSEPLIIGEYGRHVAADRHHRWQARVATSLCLLVGAAVFCTGITWGLPSRQADRHLFGDRPVWNGEQIQHLAGQRTRDAGRGADVDVNPLAVQGQVVCLNETDAQRAEIIRRYRLFTHQPDEMVTMMALAEMRPGQGDLDPRLYQYGGLWIYPVGVLLKAASQLGAITVTSNLAHYLDHPEAFGRFYIVARLYVAAWGLIGVWAVFSIVRRLTDGCITASSTAALCFVFMPVVVNMSHEAKPHLPGAVLTLLAVWMAMQYVRTAGRHWFRWSIMLSGAAVGMVLAAWPAMLVPPVATLLIRQSWRRRLRDAALAVAGMLVVYFATNPYVLIHLFDNRELLRSNLGNTRAMFTLSLSLAAFANAARLIVEGASWLPALLGVIAAVGLVSAAAVRGRRPTQPARWPASGWLIAIPAGVVGVHFVAFAAGQPGEYGRFAILADVGLMIAAIVGGRRLLRVMRWPALPLLVLPVAAAVPGTVYLSAFRQDAGDHTTRAAVAEALAPLPGRGARTLGVFAEPAPYALPPVNLFAWRLVLLPKDYHPDRDLNPPDVVVRAVDSIGRAEQSPPASYHASSVGAGFLDHRMSWAAKPFVWWVRKELAAPPAQRGD